MLVLVGTLNTVGGRDEAMVDGDTALQTAGNDPSPSHWLNRMYSDRLIMLACTYPGLAPTRTTAHALSIAPHAGASKRDERA